MKRLGEVNFVFKIFQGIYFGSASAEFRQSDKKDFQLFAGPQIFFAGLRSLTMFLILFSPDNYFKILSNR